MMTFLKKEVRKHFKWILILLLTSIVYSFVGISEFGVWVINKKEGLKNLDFITNEKNVYCELPSQYYIMIDVSGLASKQETVTINFYDEQNRLVDSKETVLCNGINNVGQLKQAVSLFRYNGTQNILIENIYCSNYKLSNIYVVLKVALSLYLICLIQYFLILVQKRYAK